MLQNKEKPSQATEMKGMHFHFLILVSALLNTLPAGSVIDPRPQSCCHPVSSCRTVFYVHFLVLIKQFNGAILFFPFCNCGQRGAGEAPD